MSVRDAASTLGRSQVFTPFENRLGHVTRSGSNSAFHFRTQRIAYGDRSISSHLVLMPLILNTTANGTGTSRVTSCSTRVGKRITFVPLENAHIHVGCGG